MHSKFGKPFPKSQNSQSMRNIPLSIMSFSQIDEHISQSILSNNSLEAKCLVFKKYSGRVQGALSGGLLSSAKQQFFPMELIICGQYLLERCAKTHQIISGFQFDYSHQFEVSRKPSIVTGRVGEIQGIRFSVKCQQNKSKQLGAQQKPKQREIDNEQMVSQLENQPTQSKRRAPVHVAADKPTTMKQTPDQRRAQSQIRTNQPPVSSFPLSSCITEFVIKHESRTCMEHFIRILSTKYIVQLGFHNLFRAHQKIGKGMTACVYSGIFFVNNKQVAIKSFKRAVYFPSENNSGQVSFKKEFKCLTQISHKNICLFEGVYETENSTYLVLELLPFSLSVYLEKFGFPSKQKTKKIMKGLLEGINYLHQKGIMHRDLKLENIMVKKNPEDPSGVVPVIVDFGLAENESATEYLYVRCGTPGYVAPEVLRIKSTDQNKTYNSKCDIFSLAVVFHILLFQKPIFEGHQLKEVIRKNCECNVDFTNDNFVKFGTLGTDLFQKMLAQNPKERITAEQALKHEFFINQNVETEPSVQKIATPTSSSILVEKIENEGSKHDENN